MEAVGAWRNANYQQRCSKIGAELPNLELLCQRKLGFPLTTLCSEPRLDPLIPHHAAASELGQDVRALAERTDISETEREQLIAARCGQGQYRTEVLLNESCCRVTGVTAPEFLRASHIKPWKDSDDFVRLDRNNGLMLSPHIDHLFDQGYITFAPDGRMVLAADLPADVVSRWQLQQVVPPRPFSKQQGDYLGYHRANRFHG